ncbi:hypothetical protein DIPPA_35755 [Diplonema papillatum]|nr:hypothetical protein DIPPA_35755 [Diplonema papillatum]
MYSMHPAVVAYNVLCLVLAVGAGVWIAVHGTRSLGLFIFETALTAVVCLEATTRAWILGSVCCRYASVWIDVTLCYVCLGTFLGAVLVPYFLYDDDESIENTLAIILLAIRFLVQIVRTGVLFHRSANALRARRQPGIDLEATTGTRNDDAGDRDSFGRSQTKSFFAEWVGGYGTVATSSNDHDFGTAEEPV